MISKANLRRIIVKSLEIDNLPAGEALSIDYNMTPDGVVSVVTSFHRLNEYQPAIGELEMYRLEITVDDDDVDDLLSLLDDYAVSLKPVMEVPND